MVGMSDISCHIKTGPQRELVFKFRTNQSYLKKMSSCMVCVSVGTDMDKIALLKLTAVAFYLFNENLKYITSCVKCAKKTSGTLM